jgi:hypothetical protein
VQKDIEIRVEVSTATALSKAMNMYGIVFIVITPHFNTASHHTLAPLP